MAKDWHYSPLVCGRQGYSDVCSKVSEGREMPGKPLGINAQTSELISIQIPTTVTFTGLCQRHLSKTECVVPR